MRMLSTYIAALLVTAAALAGHPASASAKDKPIVVDLSSHKVAITTAFAGTDLLLFGSTDRDGDVVMVVRGPREKDVVREKGRSAGIFVNKDSMTFANVPGYYAIASTKPIKDILSESERMSHEIGIDSIEAKAVDVAPGADVKLFRAALDRIKRHTGLFRVEPRPIHLLGERLFRADVRLPANVPTGAYSVEVYLIQNGKVVAVQDTPLNVEKVGFEAAVFDYAHTSSLLYGLLAIIVATAAGWLANAVFRKA